MRLKMIVPADSTWFLKNSPKFFMYMPHFRTSTTVVAELTTTPASSFTRSTA